MRTIGIYLAALAAGSIVLNLFGYELSILSWVDNWGADTGWGIRLGAIAVGAGLFLFGGPKAEVVTEA